MVPSPIVETPTYIGSRDRTGDRKISELITRVYETRTGRPFPGANISIAGFQEIFDRDLKRFAKL